MSYYHQYLEEIRAAAIDRPVAAMKRRPLNEHSRVGFRTPGQNAFHPDSGGNVEKAPEVTGRGQDQEHSGRCYSWA